eukprot:5972030-Amphidinium_carterae.1
MHYILTCWCTVCEASVQKQGGEGNGWKAKHKALRDKHSLDLLEERYLRGHPCRGVAANRSADQQGPGGSAELCGRVTAD